MIVSARDNDRYRERGYLNRPGSFQSGRRHRVSGCGNAHRARRVRPARRFDAGNRGTNRRRGPRAVSDLRDRPQLAPLFGRLIADPRIAAAVGALIGPNVKGIHSRFFIDHAGVPGNGRNQDHAGMPGNGRHQDEAFVPTRDRSLCTAWIALDEATVDNGCLRFLPGSHRSGVIDPRRRHNAPTIDREEEAYGFRQPVEDAVPIPLEPGSAVFFNGYLVRGSYRNIRPHGLRRALLSTYASAETLPAWSPAMSR
jgi:ectoine hydroxylase-related dioxygenase (phytanoyl-CoA dioxygenase family)